MRVVAIATHTLDAQQRLFLDAVRRSADLVGIVNVQALPAGKRRLRRLARRAREHGLLHALNFLGGVPVSAIVRPRIYKAVDALLSRELEGDPAEGVPTADGGLVNSEREVAAIRAFRPDLLYQAGPGITRPQVFQAAPLGMLHIHHGILPAIRGIASPEWAVRERRPLWLGVTLHMMDAGLDTGPLVAQARPRVEADDAWAAVRARLSLLAARLIAGGIRALEAGLEPVPQPATLPSAYRSNLGLTDWALFRRRLPEFLRSCRGRDEQIAVGQVLPQ
ncbi:MAG TPA: formyltransferase family protein [Planctomycetota bacterium]|nr:formyltransferase family protein [Planctomycetota bacterium]HRR78866.1 formyltransferase family protein [Planctomycetota bacterium]HRT92828.1 formyltransferase family protein [Planctomycetota bacterium]